MSRIPLAASLRLRISSDLLWVCACLSRVLLLLAAVEVITMPLTQHFWTWDHFLHGGQDFELGLLMIVTCLCFLLLRAHSCRQNLRMLLAIGIHLWLKMERREKPGLQHCGRLSTNAEHPPSGGPSELRSLPLLI